MHILPSCQQIYGKFHTHMSGSIKTEHLAFCYVTGRSMEISMYTSGSIITINILHITVSVEDLWKFPYTFLGQL